MIKLKKLKYWFLPSILATAFLAWTMGYKRAEIDVFAYEQFDNAIISYQTLSADHDVHRNSIRTLLQIHLGTAKKYTDSFNLLICKQDKKRILENIEKTENLLETR